MPDASVLPPEVFNNINILTILVSIPLFEKMFKRMYGIGNRPPVVGRIVAGFVLMLIAMSIIATFQGVIVSRGSFVTSSSSPANTSPTTTTASTSFTTTSTTPPLSQHHGGDDDFPEDHEETIAYVLSDGKEYISAAWLVIPYFIQGLASVLVDTTCIEAAYTSAPENMKGSVMALYLLASSVSGLLGLIYAPFVAPQTMLEIMISLTMMQGIVTVVFMMVTTSSSSSSTIWTKLSSWMWWCCCCRRRHGGGGGFSPAADHPSAHESRVTSGASRNNIASTSVRSVLSGGAQFTTITAPREHDESHPSCAHLSINQHSHHLKSMSDKEKESYCILHVVHDSNNNNNNNTRRKI